jgi:2-oxo-4-hydroxy-4-carboxy-5-ureidoimidazoline decarboxylase
MRGHPPIGARSASPDARVRDWSAMEQAAAQADPETMRALVLETSAYAQRFGHIFLVSASGKDATMLLDAVRQRMQNPREVELRVAAEELRKIARLRLEKLLDARAET